MDKKSQQQPKLETLAATFLVKYYTVLLEKPDQIRNYYHQDSKITRRYDVEAGEYIFGADDIHEYYLNVADKFGKVSFQTIDCQTVGADAYFISSTGIIIFEGVQRPFSQCFFLEKIDTSIFISNDIMTISHHEEPLNDTDQPDEASNAEESQPQLNGIHQDSEVIVSAETTPANATVVVEQQPTTTTAASAVVVVDIAPQSATTTTTTTLPPSSESTPTLAPVAAEQPSPSPASSPVVEEKTLEKEHKPKSPDQTTVKTSPAASVQSKPPSYADLAKTTLPSPPPATTTTSPTTSTTTTASPQPTTTTTTTIVQEEDIKEITNNITNNNNNKKNHQPFSKDGCTLFFSYKSTLKFEVSQVKESFKQFGVVLNVRILTGYGFVEFDKTESVQQVLNFVSNNNKISVGGTPLHNVELRKGIPPPPKGKSLKDKVRKDQKLENNTPLTQNNTTQNNIQKPLQPLVQQQNNNSNNNNNNNNNNTQNNLNSRNRKKDANSGPFKQR
ncbi:hypothetical protein CYY_004462 [Polysphondylium violaceum]|uniref:NTF2 domain-containing protein n=1 Tax=Polysphondylium violaceum TaxID=133409 RepID=A0A8J4Q5A5_9MYCE|nr:hypothetical protein CYY_004462 [Polysphondylium violaceum]